MMQEKRGARRGKARQVKSSQVRYNAQAHVHGLTSCIHTPTTTAAYSTAHSCLDEKKNKNPSHSGRCHTKPTPSETPSQRDSKPRPPQVISIKAQDPNPKNAVHATSLPPSFYYSLTKAPTPKPASTFTPQLQTLVRATHRIVVKPLDAPIAASQTDIVKPTDGKSAARIVKSRVFRIDELRTRLRTVMPREGVRVVSVVFGLLGLSSGGTGSVGDDSVGCRGVFGRAQTLDKTPLFPPHEHPFPAHLAPPLAARECAHHLPVVQVAERG